MSAKIAAHRRARRSKPPVGTGTKGFASVVFGVVLIWACGPEAIELSPQRVVVGHSGGQTTQAFPATPTGGLAPAVSGAPFDGASSGGTSSGGAERQMPASGGWPDQPVDRERVPSTGGGYRDSSDGSDGCEDCDSSGGSDGSRDDDPDEVPFPGQSDYDVQWCDPSDDDPGCGIGKYCEADYRCTKLCESLDDCDRWWPRYACAEDGRCVECADRTPCAYPDKAICHHATGTCHECTEDYHCVRPGDEPRCVEFEGELTCGCEDDEDCAGFAAENRLHCSRATVSCVECTKPEHCSGSTGVCSRLGNCVECDGPDDCPSDAPLCTRLGTCVECFDDIDCPDGLHCIDGLYTCEECAWDWHCEVEAGEVCDPERFVCEPQYVAEQ